MLVTHDLNRKIMLNIGNLKVRFFSGMVHECHKKL